MNNERFAVPEILFHPSDIGIQEMGIAEAVVHVVSLTPPGTRETFNRYKRFCWQYFVCMSDL